jgi:hypothetical protein
MNRNWPNKSSSTWIGTSIGSSRDHSNSSSQPGRLHMSTIVKSRGNPLHWLGLETLLSASLTAPTLTCAIWLPPACSLSVCLGLLTGRL